MHAIQSPDILGLNWLPMLALYSKIGNKECNSQERGEIGTELRKLNGNEGIIIDGINKKLDELIKKNDTSVDITTLKTEIISKLSDKIDSRSNSPVTCTNNSVNIPSNINEILEKVVGDAIESVFSDLADLTTETHTATLEMHEAIGDLLIRKGGSGDTPLPNVIEDTEEVPGTVQPDVDGIIHSFINGTKYAGYSLDAIKTKSKRFIESQRVEGNVVSELSAIVRSIRLIAKNDVEGNNHIEIPNLYPRSIFENIIRKRIERETQFSGETITKTETSSRINWSVKTLDMIGKSIWPGIDGEIYKYATLIIRILDSFQSLSTVDVIETTQIVAVPRFGRF